MTGKNNAIEIKYNNDLNVLPLPKLSGRQMDLFYSILAHTNEKNQSFLGKFITNKEIEIPYNRFVEICRANNWKKGFVEVASEIDSFLKLIVDYKIFYEDEHKKYAFVCFEKAIWDKFEQTIKVTFQKDFYEMVMNYKLGFTRFELSEFLMFTSEYTKRLYIHLKQYRTQGWWLIEWEEFKRLMQIPSSYQISDIDKQVLKQAIKDLTKERTLEDQIRIPFKNLKYEKLTYEQKQNRRRQTPYWIKFTFTIEHSILSTNDELIGKLFLHKDKKNNEFVYRVEQITEKLNKIIVDCSVFDKEMNSIASYFTFTFKSLTEALEVISKNLWKLP